MKEWKIENAGFYSKPHEVFKAALKLTYSLGMKNQAISRMTQFASDILGIDLGTSSSENNWDKLQEGCEHNIPSIDVVADSNNDIDSGFNAINDDNDNDNILNDVEEDCIVEVQQNSNEVVAGILNNTQETLQMTKENFDEVPTMFSNQEFCKKVIAVGQIIMKRSEKTLLTPNHHSWFPLTS